MEPNKKRMIPYGKQSINEEDINAVVEVLKSDYLTTGPWVENFERELCAVTGAKYAIACSNGTTALHIACLSLGITDKSLGWTSPNTFLASANCIEFCGGTTDFVDIDETLCLSPEKLLQKLNAGKIPDVVIPVDFAGVPADLPAIWEPAQKYKFKVIEDAAHAIGSTYSHDGITYQCGSCIHSNAAILSFHPVKTITCGEGGAVLTNDPEVARQARLFRSHGMTKDPQLLAKNDGPWYYEMIQLANNYRITDLQCALGLSQLKKLDQFKKRRQEIVKRYTEAFSTVNGLIPPPWPTNTDPCFHLYVLQFANGAQTRLDAFNFLKGKNILTQVHYIPVHTQPYYEQKYGYSFGKCLKSEVYYSGCLSLPLYPSITDDEVSYVIRKVTEFMRNSK